MPHLVKAHVFIRIGQTLATLVLALHNSLRTSAHIDQPSQVLEVRPASSNDEVDVDNGEVMVAVHITAAPEQS